MFKKLSIAVVTLATVLLPLNTALAATPPTVLDQGMVSLNFDDGWKNIHDNGLPILNQYAIPSTQYLNSTPVIDGYPDYMTYNDIKDFTVGPTVHELAWHTQTHADLTLPTTNVATELTIPQDFLTGIGKTAADFKNFASPYGSYNPTVQASIMASYRSHRSTDVGFNVPSTFNANNILVQNILDNTTPAQVAAWVAEAKLNKSWLVIVYHVVLEDTQPLPEPSAENYSVTKTELATELADIKASGIAVKTVDAALDVMQGITVTPPPALKPGDTNGDNLIDAGDLDAVLRNWGQGLRSRGQGNLTDNTDPAHVIDASDLDAVLRNWSK